MTTAPARIPAQALKTPRKKSPLYMLDAMKRLLKRAEERPELLHKGADERLYKDASSYSLKTQGLDKVIFSDIIHGNFKMPGLNYIPTPLPTRYAGMAKGRADSKEVYAEFREVWHQLSTIHNEYQSRTPINWND